MVFAAHKHIGNIIAVALIAVSGLTAQAADGSKDTVPAEISTSAYSFGWQRFTPVDGGWSVLMPNEPEP